MNEFDFIATRLAPLAGPGGLGLKDDAALLKPNPGKDLVLTKDTMVEGVHFPMGHYGANTAGKLLRANLSDLAAKGARPIGYLLSIVWPKHVDRTSFAEFASGLSEVQQAYDFKLLGGDTTATDGPMVVTATFIGELPTGEMVTRSGANIGDDIWVTGTIGDAYIGLRHALETLPPKGDEEVLRHFFDAYYRPEPRLLFRKTLRKFATACADISDGLVADAGHIADLCGVSFDITSEKIPLSKYAAKWLVGKAEGETAFKTLITAGDDYELVFTALPGASAHIRKAAMAIGMRVTKLGTVQKGSGVSVLSDGEIMQFETRGYTHF